MIALAISEALKIFLLNSARVSSGVLIVKWAFRVGSCGNQPLMCDLKLFLTFIVFYSCTGQGMYINVPSGENSEIKTPWSYAPSFGSGSSCEPISCTVNPPPYMFVD